MLSSSLGRPSPRRRVGDAFYIKAGEVGGGCVSGNFLAMSVIFFKISVIFSRIPGFLSGTGVNRSACVGILSMWRSVVRIFHYRFLPARLSQLRPAGKEDSA